MRSAGEHPDSSWNADPGDPDDPPPPEWFDRVPLRASEVACFLLGLAILLGSLAVVVDTLR